MTIDNRDTRVAASRTRRDAGTPEQARYASTGAVITAPPGLGPVPPGTFRIIIETSFGALVPQVVVAASVREALTAAYALPVRRWYPEEQ